VDFSFTSGERMTQYFSFNTVLSLAKALAFSALLLLGSLGIAAAQSINVNTATQSELESIKGIGPAKAKTIIAERLDGGHFQDANDLQKRVRGIGMKSVEKMVDNGLSIEAPGSFREPNGRTQKDGGASGRRNSRTQNGNRYQQDRAGDRRRN
jgi:competence ComEA-like helix-hairpin-helix protein